MTADNTNNSTATDVQMHVDTAETLPGRYFKFSAPGSAKPRMGTAHTVVNEDGSLAYVNRRGESVVYTFAQFVAKWDEGYTVHNGRNLEGKTAAQVLAEAEKAAKASAPPITAGTVEALLAEMSDEALAEEVLEEVEFPGSDEESEPADDELAALERELAELDA